MNELAAPFAMSLPAISKHIRVLEKAGLITQTQRAQYRPCQIDAAPLQEVSDWAEQYRAVWEASFERLDSYLEQLQSKQKETQDE